MEKPTSTTELTEEQIKLAAELTTLQKKFVINLLSPNTSQRQAYIAAGGQSKTEKAQDASASRILADVKVKAFYESLLKSAASTAVMTREEALERLSWSARVTIKDVCDFKNVKIGEDENGEPVFQTVWTMKNAEDIPDHIAASIKSVTITKTGPKIELYDSNAAKKQLADLEGWNSATKHVVSGKLEVSQVTRRIVKAE